MTLLRVMEQNRNIMGNEKSLTRSVQQFRRGNISGRPVGEYLHCRLHDAPFKFKYGDL